MEQSSDLGNQNIQLDTDTNKNRGVENRAEEKKGPSFLEQPVKYK